MCLVSVAWAREDSVAEEELATVVVTASRFQEQEGEALSATTVITQQTIRNKQLADLASLLRSEAGIEFDRMGGPGMVTSVFMRGSNANRVLVQLDGVPVTDGSVMGSAAILSQLQPDQIDRIEIVRGDISAVYGMGAAGGVIRIFTKRGEGRPSASLFAEYGSRDTSRLGARVSGQSDDTRFALTASRSDTRGFSTMSSSENPMVNPDRDGNENVTVTGNVSCRFGADGELGMRLYLGDARYDYDIGGGPDEVNTGRNRQWIGAVYGKKRFSPDWLSALTLSRMDIGRKYETKYGIVRPSSEWNGMVFPLRDPNGKSDSRARTSLLQWHNDVVLSGDWTATAGVEAGHEEAESGKDGRSSVWNRDRYSLYGGISGKTGAHDWQVNVRYDRAGQADSAVSGYLGYGHALTPVWKLVGNISTSFLVPTLYQQYNPMYGNRDLKAEKTRAAEVGVQYASAETRVRLTAFSWFTRDLIDFDSALHYVNVGKARNRGLEMVLHTVLAGMDVNTSLTVQQPEDVSAETVLARRARRLGTFNVSKTSGWWYAGGNVQYTGERVDGSHRLPAYWLASLDVRCRISREVSVYGRIENLFDKDYETVYGYNQPSRGIYVGVDLTM